MSAEVQEFRLAAMEAINRLASIEARLSREADVSGDETLGLVHEHGEIVLREAAHLIQRLGRE